MHIHIYAYIGKHKYLLDLIFPTLKSPKVHGQNLCHDIPWGDWESCPLEAIQGVHIYIIK